MVDGGWWMVERDCTVTLQELAGHRLELDYMLKLPAEERLI